MPAMLENVSNFTAGDVAQINAKKYHHTGKTLVKGQYTSNVEINAGVYNHHEVRTADSATLRELYAHVAVGAMHNSNDRADAPKCHPETRKAVQENIFSWISRNDAEGEPKQILWLTGPAGSGKTAIMGTVSEKLEENGQLAASFYFASYTNLAERMSKRFFVPTLAYQLHWHPTLKEHLSTSIMTTIEEHPAIFEMSLKDQMEKLVLQHLRRLQSTPTCLPTSPMVIIVDGIDECGEDPPYGRKRSREKDQTEVLSALLQAAKDPGFPFRIVVASRPESWIRQCLMGSAANHVTEVFLDDRYNADEDIALFLRSKFAELRRCYDLPSTWADGEVIEQLVESASGQFIYPATVLRFIDSPPLLPHDQLKIVLSIRSTDGANPFGPLDALHTSILRSSPKANDTVLWLKAYLIIRFTQPTVSKNRPTTPSAWTIDRLFESGPGQARMCLTLPSLIYLKGHSDTPIVWDSAFYGTLYKAPDSLIPTGASGWYSRYTFYHKSFSDFLRDDLRCGVAFPDINHCDVEQFLWKRLSQVLKCS